MKLLAIKKGVYYWCEWSRMWGSLGNATFYGHRREIDMLFPPRACSNIKPVRVEIKEIKSKEDNQ